MTPEAERDLPSIETLEILRNIATEINCGKVLIARTPEERMWNNAHERALQIISNYAQGFGLFQMTRRAERRKTEVPR